MANTISTTIIGEGVGPAYEKYLKSKTSAIVLLDKINEKQDQVHVLTRGPFWEDTAVLSAYMGDVDIVQVMQDQDAPGRDIMRNVWNSGKMKEAYVLKYDYEKMDYKDESEEEPYPITDRFDVDIEDLNDEMEDLDIDINDL